MFVVKCPRCGKRSKAFVDQAGFKGRCPHCSRKIRITAVEGERPTDEYPAVKAEPRAIQGTQRVRLPDTSPPTLLLGLLALLLTWALYLAGDHWLAESVPWVLLRSCRWVGYVETFGLIWGMLLLIWKAYLRWSQAKALRWKLFPSGAVGASTPRQSIEAYLVHVQSLTPRPARYILLNRVRLALEHFRETGSLREVRGALAGQSAIDANLLESSYSMLRFLVWVVPILGFIGTVMGIGIAVNHFSSFIPAVSEIEEAMDSLRQGLGQVTSGLGTAFNTTLVALCFVVPLMLLTSWLRKSEEHLLARFDAFSNAVLIEELAKLLASGRAATTRPGQASTHGQTPPRDEHILSEKGAQA